jgi:hypothetical protein
MSTQEHDPAREALAELHVEIRLDESLRAMALADIKAPLMEVSLSASVAERIAGAHLDGRLRDAIRDIRESAARAIALLSGLADETSLNVDLRVIDVSEAGGDVPAGGAAAREGPRGAHRDRPRAGEHPRPGRPTAHHAGVGHSDLRVLAAQPTGGSRAPRDFERRPGGARVTVTDAGPRLTSDEVEALLSPVLASDGGLPTRDLSRALRATVVQGGLLRVEPAGDGMAFILELPPPPHR